MLGCRDEDERGRVESVCTMYGICSTSGDICLDVVGEKAARPTSDAGQQSYAGISYRSADFRVAQVSSTSYLLPYLYDLFDVCLTSFPPEKVFGGDWDIRVEAFLTRPPC